MSYCCHRLGTAYSSASHDLGVFQLAANLVSRRAAAVQASLARKLRRESGRTLDRWHRERVVVSVADTDSDVVGREARAMMSRSTFWQEQTDFGRSYSSVKLCSLVN